MTHSRARWPQGASWNIKNAINPEAPEIFVNTTKSRIISINRRHKVCLYVTRIARVMQSRGKFRMRVEKELVDVKSRFSGEKSESEM